MKHNCDLTPLFSEMSDKAVTTRNAIQKMQVNLGELGKTIAAGPVRSITDDLLFIENQKLACDFDQ